MLLWTSDQEEFPIILVAHQGATLNNVFDHDFNSTERLGQNVVQRGENNKYKEAEDAHDDRHEKINEADHSHRALAEDDHRKADKSVDQAHQDIESGRDLAGLQN